MHELSSADKIWNRACYGGGETPKTGDKALAALLLFHGPAMNGGVLHAVECLSKEKLEKAKDGYIYFGFGVIADLISSGQDAIENNFDLEKLETRMNKKYWELIPEDGVLVKSFENHQKQNPLEYSPISD